MICPILGNVWKQGRSRLSGLSRLLAIIITRHKNTRLEYRSSLLLGAAFSYIDSTSVTLSLSISGCGRERHAGSRIAGWIFDSRVQVQIIPEIERHLERVKMLRNATETSDRRL